MHTATQMDFPSSSLFPDSVPPVFLAGGGPGGPQLPSGQSGSSGCNIGVSNDSGSLEMSDSVGALSDGSFAEGLLDMALSLMLGSERLQASKKSITRGLFKKSS